MKYLILVWLQHILVIFFFVHIRFNYSNVRLDINMVMDYVFTILVYEVQSITGEAIRVLCSAIHFLKNLTGDCLCSDNGNSSLWSFSTDQ